MDGVERLRGERRMRLAAAARGPQRRLALVADGDPHRSRFANDRHPRQKRRGCYGLQERTHANAPDFLVIGESEMERRGEVHTGGAIGGREGAGEKALHVGGAPRGQAPIEVAQTEGITAPRLPVHRDHVGVA